MSSTDDLHWFLDGAVIYEPDSNRAFLNMTHHEFERRLRELIGMEEVNKTDAKDVKRGRGRPRKSESLTTLGIGAELGEVFKAAKEQHEKNLPYTLTQTQFVAVLLQSFNSGSSREPS